LFLSGQQPGSSAPFSQPGVIASTRWPAPPVLPPTSTSPAPPPIPEIDRSQVPPSQLPIPALPQPNIQRTSFEESQPLSQPLTHLLPPARGSGPPWAGVALTVQVIGPSEAAVGTPVEVEILVRNLGTALAEGVRVVQKLPPGLNYLGGEPAAEVVGDRLLWVLGGLPGQDERRLRCQLRGDSFDAFALAPTTTFTTPTYRPSPGDIAALKLRLEPPGSVLVGKETELRLVLGWTNQHAARGNVRLRLSLPDGVDLVKASHGGKLEPAPRKTDGVGRAPSGQVVSWEVPAPPTGREETVSVLVRAEVEGFWPLEAEATVLRATPARVNSVLRVEAEPTLGLDVQVREDPLEVGEETVYELRVANPGRAVARNVRLAVGLPAGVTPVQGDGPVPGQIQSGVFLFEPLRSLASQQQVLYRVRVRGLKAGDWRFRAELSADQLQRPVLQEVSVRVREGRARSH
jgi:hypothetical protein